jgi:hypothetical protein
MCQSASRVVGIRFSAVPEDQTASHGPRDVSPGSASPSEDQIAVRDSHRPEERPDVGVEMNHA